MDFKQRFARAWDRAQEKVGELTDDVREGVSQVRVEVESRIDDAWESPTERHLRKQVGTIQEEKRQAEARANSLREQVDNLTVQRNVGWALFVAAVATCVMMLLL